MIRRPPRSTRTTHSFPTRRSSDLGPEAGGTAANHQDVALSGHRGGARRQGDGRRLAGPERSEEHTSELQSLMRISYSVFRLKKTTHTNNDSTSCNVMLIFVCH